MTAGLQEVKFRIYNHTLDPNLWDENMVINPEVKVKLLKVAQDFYRNTELKAPIVDILFLGSTTNYNWTPTSDIDLHLVVDITKENIAPEHARQFMDGLGAGWNNSHEISIKGHPVEVYLQDQTEKNSTPAQARKGSTIYSLLKGVWLKAPDRQRIDIDKEKIKQKYRKIKKMVDEFVADKDVEKLKKLMKALKNYRNAGLEQVGEFSTENLVFKALRHTEVITKLKDAINTLYDKSVSITEVGVKKSPFLVVGITNDSFQVLAQKDPIGGIVHHERLHRPGYDTTGDEIHWRYKSFDNTLYWWKMDIDRLADARKTSDIRDTTLDYLHTKYGVTNPKESYNQMDFHVLAHRIDENVGIGHLYVGLITPELKVVGRKATPNKTGHMTLFPDYHAKPYRAWRFRTDLNTLYWWDTPDEDEKDEVIQWLQKYLGVTQRPKQVVMPSVDTVRAGQGKSIYGTPTWYDSHPEKSIDELLEKDAELFLGFIRRDNLKVVGTHVEDEDFTHFHFQFELGGEWINLGDDSLIPWRYKKSENTIYWWYPRPHPNDDEKQAVEWWLEKNVNVKYPHHKMMSNFAPDALDRIDNKKRAHNMSTDMNEGKFDPFTTKELNFVTYGGLSLTKQKGYGKSDPTFHAPPARKGIYAFVWPYIERFLLGGDYADPKKRGKGQRQRIQYVKDKEGNPITSDHPDYEKHSDIPKNWSISRDKPNPPPQTDDSKWEDSHVALLYRNTPRKKFKYGGPVWHHLKAHIPQHAILDEKNEWVKTDMATFKEAFRKELSSMLKSAHADKDQRGLKATSWDHLEVFIDQKI